MRWRRKSQKDEVLKMLFELTGMVWQLGAVLSVSFMIFAVLSLRWVRHSIAVAESSPLLAQLAAAYGWVLFALPILFLFWALIFGKKTLDGYLDNHF